MITSNRWQANGRGHEMDTALPGCVSFFCFVLFSGPIGAVFSSAAVAFGIVDAGECWIFVTISSHSS